jgi:hypothetical protein
MLETVREFGAMQLVGAGEDAAARDALLAWARGYVAQQADRLWSADQVDAMRAVLAEENNLADCLRDALAAPDPWTTAQLLSVLAAFWTIKGDNVRVIALAGAVEETLLGWEPEPDQVETAVAAAVMTAMNTVLGEIMDVPVSISLIQRYGDRVTSPRVRGLVTVLAAQDASGVEDVLARLDAIGSGPDRYAAAMARMWAAHHRENSGDPEGALAEAEKGLALVRDEDGPWTRALLRTLLAGLNAQLGKRADAAELARAALPDLDRLEAIDDSIQVRSLLSVEAMATGQLDAAERYIAGRFVTGMARAELALARGQIGEGLRLYRIAVRELREITFPGMDEPTGLEPWALFGESAGATAYAVHGSGEDGADLFEALRSKVMAVLDPERPHLDYPVAGLVLYGLGAWGLLKDALPVEDAVRLLVLADLFAYARYTLTLSPEYTTEEAERRASGLAARLREEYGARKGPDLLPEARAVAARITG